MVFQPPEWASQPSRTATLHVRPAFTLPQGACTSAMSPGLGVLR